MCVCHVENNRLTCLLAYLLTYLLGRHKSNKKIDTEQDADLCYNVTCHTYNFADDGRDVEIFNDESSCVAPFNPQMTHWCTNHLPHNGRYALSNRTVGASKTCDRQITTTFSSSNSIIYR